MTTTEILAVIGGITLILTAAARIPAALAEFLRACILVTTAVGELRTALTKRVPRDDPAQAENLSCRVHRTPDISADDFGNRQPESRPSRDRHGRRDNWGGMTPQQRRLRAQIAANTRWSRPMAHEDASDTARSAFYARLERQTDPQGKLPPSERQRLVRAAARAFSARLNSAKSRKQRPAFPVLYDQA